MTGEQNGIVYAYVKEHAGVVESGACRSQCEGDSVRQSKGEVLEGETLMQPISAPKNVYEHCLIATGAAINSQRAGWKDLKTFKESDDLTLVFERNHAYTAQ